jgi:hypothetical protein
MLNRASKLFFSRKFEDDLPFAVGYGLDGETANADKGHIGKAFVSLDLLEANGVL